MPNHAAGYTVHGTTASFLTLVTTGPPGGSVSGTVTADGVDARACWSGGAASVRVEHLAGTGERVTVQRYRRCGDVG